MNPSTAFARVLVDELVRCGLREVVLAPGSRSAPLAMAAHADQRVRLHVRIDERSAAYTALGLGKVHRQPAMLVCSSGTAATNFFPAVMEASHAGVPLLAVTADRPPELRDTGANQTIDQVKLYGDAVRWCCEVGVPEARKGAVAYWRSLAARAWLTALGSHPGPVHLNVSFREPLTPEHGDSHDSSNGSDNTGPSDSPAMGALAEEPPSSESHAWPEPLDGRPGGRPWTAATASSWPAAGKVATPEIPAVERGVLVAGDGHADPAPYVAMAEERGWPVLAEPTSGARYGPNALSTYPYLLAAPDFLVRHLPDVVVTVGKPGLSRAVLAMLESVPEHIVISGDAMWPDPVRSATRLYPAAARYGDSSARVPRRRADTAWLRAWLAADDAARSAIDKVLDAQQAVTEPLLARDLAGALPEGALLFAGASMPIRDLERGMPPRGTVRVLGNRGTNGIDGSVSTAVGAALAHGGPACALLGDLTLLHDQNGLLLGPHEPCPDLTIVAINNNGGRIFSLLPQADHPEPFERVFATPHDVDLERVAGTARIPYTRLERGSDLEPLVTAGQGLRLVEVPTGRGGSSDIRPGLQHAVDGALSGS